MLWPSCTMLFACINGQELSIAGASYICREDPGVQAVYLNFPHLLRVQNPTRINHGSISEQIHLWLYGMRSKASGTTQRHGSGMDGCLSHVAACPVQRIAVAACSAWLNCDS